MVFYPGGIRSSNPVKPSTSSASGLWSITEQLQASYTGIWPATSAASGSVNAIVAMIGGGAGATGGVSGPNYGAGGAGGVLRYANSVIISGGGSNYTVVVGAGGAGIATGTPSSGSNSTFGTSSVIATGGNGASSSSTIGGSNADYAGGTGSGTYGAGGGAGAAGNGGASNAGGPGANIAISGTFVSYGGGGAGKSTSAATGGIGGGGNSDTSGANNTGGGAGGTSAGLFYNGGSGIVIINYPAPQYFTGGVVTNVNNLAGSNIVHTFNTSSTMTALATPIDTYQPYNTLLVHADGTNSSNTTVIIDSSTSAATFTNTGKPTQGTFSPFSTAGWSNYFPTTSDYATAASNSGFGFSGAFTIELWAFFTTSAAGTVTGVTTAGGIALYETSSLLTANLFGTGDIFASTFNVANNLGKWLHIVLARGAGNAMNIWVNGTSYGTGTSATVFTAGAWSVTYTAGPKGYFSNLRVTNTDVYGVGNSTIIVPNSALSIVAGTLLLTCQSNRFVDNSSSLNAITVTGTPQVQPFSPFNPTSAYSNTTVGGSMYFGGSDYATSTGSASYSVGTGNFTIEFWLYMGGTSATGLFALNSIPGPNSASGLAIYLSASGVISFFVNGNSGATNSATGTILPNQWYHVALIRNGSTNTIYVNGVATTATNSTTPNPSASPAFGLARIYNDSFTAGSPLYISNLRVTSGIAVYTSFPFTPPTSPLAANSSTLLLASGTNTGIIDNTQKNNITTYGSAAISTTQSKFGGSSLLLNGTTDYIKFNNPLIIGTQAYTMECWFYLNSTSFSPNFYPFIGTSTNSGSALDIRINSTTTIQVDSNNSTTTNFTLPVTLTTGVWYHVAVTRDSASNCNVWLNGVRSTSGNQTVSTNYTGTTDTIGYVNGSPSAYFNGYIDEFRLTLGIARYNNNFTPQTSAFLNT